MEVTSKVSSDLDHTFILTVVLTVIQADDLPKITATIRSLTFVEIVAGDIRRTTKSVKCDSGYARWDSKCTLCVSTK